MASSKGLPFFSEILQYFPQWSCAAESLREMPQKEWTATYPFEPQHLHWATVEPSVWDTKSPFEPPHLRWATTYPYETPNLHIFLTLSKYDCYSDYHWKNDWIRFKGKGNFFVCGRETLFKQSFKDKSFYFHKPKVPWMLLHAGVEEILNFHNFLKRIANRHQLVLCSPSTCRWPFSCPPATSLCTRSSTFFIR